MIEALKPLVLTNANLPVVDTLTMQSSHPSVWCGGDLAGVAETTVEAVNDGKTAAWSIHCSLEVFNFLFCDYLYTYLSKFFYL